MPVELVLQGRASAILFPDVDDPRRALRCQPGRLREAVRPPDERCPVGVRGPVAALENVGAEPLKTGTASAGCATPQASATSIQIELGQPPCCAAAQAPSMSPSSINTRTRTP